MPLVLVVDDDPDAAVLVQRWLTSGGFRAEALPDAEALLDALSRTLPDVVCLDLGLPGMSGLEVLAQIRERHRTVPVIILTGDRDIATVVDAMRMGAYDYLSKPPTRTKLLTTVRNAAEKHTLSTRVEQLQRELKGPGFDQIVGRSAPMRQLFSQIAKVAASDITVLVRGDSGTGKELVAHALHDNGARASGPFVAVNCAAIPETLQDSEFFGHEKGAFTGAVAARAGRFEQADGGTLLLDEIGELSPSLQAKLLRVLQERRFERVGGTKSIESNFRLVAATHRDLRQMVADGQFREDLFFRVAVFELEIPPLRERLGDLVPLTAALIERIVPIGSRPRTVSQDAMTAIAGHTWPGNVRELFNVLQRAVVVAEGPEIRKVDLPKYIIDPGATAPHSGKQGNGDRTEPAANEMTLDELERWAIEREIQRAGGNLSEVGRTLGIGRTTLYRKLKRYGIR